MNNLEIYVNQQKLDLRGSDVVSLTKQINDIAEIQKRNADFTNRFTILRTPQNVLISEGLNVPNVQNGPGSTIPYKYAQCDIYQNGIPILQNGRCMFTETRNRREYELMVYGGNYDLYSKINGKYITDIDWSDLVHTFDITTKLSSYLNTDGYIYPLAATITNENTFINEYQVPCVFVKTIWDRILTEAQIPYSGSFFDDDTNFNNELVVADADYVDKSLYPIVFEITPIAYGFGTMTPTNLVTFSIPKTGRYDIKSIINIGLADRGLVKYQIYRGSSIPLELLYEEEIISSGTCIATVESLNFNLNTNLQLTKDDLITVSLFFYPTSCGWPNLPYGNIPAGSTVELTMTNSYLYLDEIDFSKCLPKISQIAFMRAIMQQYGLVYKTNNDNSIEFMRIEDIINTSGGIYDASDKFVSELSETYNIGNYGILNNFTYDYNSDDEQNTGYADSFFTIPDIDNISDKTNIIDSIIEACGDKSVVELPLNLASTHSYSNTETDTTKPPIYVLNKNDKLKVVMLNRSWAIPYSIFSPLHWNILRDTYYPEFIKMVQTPLKKKVVMWLTALDLYNIDMFKVVYLEQYQSYFYLNKINNFVSGKPTECELIKIYP